MRGSLPARVVGLEEDYWRIRSDPGGLDLGEQQELKAYYDEIHFPSRRFPVLSLH